MAALETKDLTKKFFAVKAVDNLTLSLPAGNITGIIGPNGSGKSTLLNLLSGICKSDQGKIKVKGRALADVNPHRIASYGIARTFQGVRLFNQMTTIDNILLALSEKSFFRSLSRRTEKNLALRANEILRAAGLADWAYKPAGELSYGQRKLLEITRVLVAPADIILLDEPFAGLFPEIIVKVSALLKKTRADGRTVMLVEHNLKIIRELCDVVYVLDRGKLIAGGPPGETLSRPEVLAAYLGN